MAFRSSSHIEGSEALPVPSGVAANDIIFAICSNDSAANPTIPTGFTSLAALAAYGPDGSVCRIVSWKRAAGA